MIRVTVEDDFSLDKIIACGQCFRGTVLPDGFYRFIHREHVLRLRQCPADTVNVTAEPSITPGAGLPLSPGKNGIAEHLGIVPVILEADTDEAEWNSLWRPYFDLDRSYAALRASIPGDDSFMRKAAFAGAGIRILKQDPWETLVTFILSQRKSIPAIRQCVEMLCGRWGSPVAIGGETIYTFPTPGQLRFAAEEEFRVCKAGYRAPYLTDAVDAVLSGRVDLEGLLTGDYCDVTSALTQIKGVGIKVANCVALFAYGQTSAAPVDTWINKIIEREYGGINPFPGYGDKAGILQQYAFYYALTHKEEV